MTVETTAPAPRRRTLFLAALVGLAVVLGAGVAAAVGRAAAPSQPAATGQASLYVPFTAGQQVQTGVAPGAAGAGSAVAGAPAAFSQVAGGGAMASSLAYPYPGPGPWCTGAPAAPATGPGITATGLAQVTLPVSPQQTETLSAGVQSSGNQDVATALSDAQHRLSAIRDALHAAGVPDAQISQQGLSVYANGAPKPTGVNINGSISATIGDPAVLDRALRGVVAAGASNVNVWTGGAAGGATPDEKTLQGAIAKATDAARSTAQSQAQAAGVALGALQSSQAQPPSICGWSAGGAQMVVAVTLTYAIR